MRYERTDLFVCLNPPPKQTELEVEEPTMQMTVTYSPLSPLLGSPGIPCATAKMFCRSLALMNSPNLYIRNTPLLVTADTAVKLNQRRLGRSALQIEPKASV